MNHRPSTHVAIAHRSGRGVMALAIADTILIVENVIMHLHLVPFFQE